MANITTASIITLIRGIIKDNLKTNGRDAFEFGTDTSFQLSKDYISSSTIKVYKNGTLLTLTTHYTYNSSTNKVTITTVLVAGDDIIITYSYYEKYSDTEIQDYIKSNLVWFTRRRYKKIFYMNVINEVVTLNGMNPTEEEGNIIAIVTAIDIDPRNIRIRTPDFTIEPEERKSKTELIDDVFDQFTRSFGSFDFMEVR
jgi:hypothetical protein